MSVATTFVETPWLTSDGRPKLQIVQTDTFDDGSYTEAISNEMPPGATVITRAQYDAAIATLSSGLQSAESTSAFQSQQDAASRAALVATIIPKLIELGFTPQEAEAIYRP